MSLGNGSLFSIVVRACAVVRMMVRLVVRSHAFMHPGL